jgi:threonine dehydrogenase-like Zn-dependent dehydrogenase
VNGFERLNRYSAINTADTVVIQGAGPVGLYSAVMASQSAAANVIVIGAPAARLEFAYKWGATHTIDIEKVTDPAERTKIVKEITGGRGAEVVIECSGFPPAINEGFDLLAKAGTYLIMGQTSTKTIEFMPNIFMAKQAVVIGSGSADIRHFYKALKFIQAHKGKYPFEELISTKYELEDLNIALDNMHKGKDIKGAIDCRNR